MLEYAFSSVIDEVIRNVTGALRAKGMWANTLMVFSADKFVSRPCPRALALSRSRAARPPCPSAHPL